jgi:hypothetical protein
MPAAMKTATAVETSAAKTTTARYSAAAESTACEAVCYATTSGEPATEAGATVKSTAVESRTPVEASSVKPTPSVVAMKPWAGADEQASRKPVGPVVPVGRASIRVIAIVAIRADWRVSVSVPVPWADPNANNHSLCVRIGRTKHANSQ